MVICNLQNDAVGVSNFQQTFQGDSFAYKFNEREEFALKWKSVMRALKVMKASKSARSIF